MQLNRQLTFFDEVCKVPVLLSLFVVAVSSSGEVSGTVPVPHEREQRPWTCQSESTQSTVHGCMQARDSERAGHACPPLNTSITTARKRICTPEPHWCEHGDHSVK